MTKCLSNNCGSTEFYLDDYYEWICAKCNTGQMRYNCGFHKCCREYQEEYEVFNHIKRTHGWVRVEP